MRAPHSAATAGQANPNRRHSANLAWNPRLATEADIAALEGMIERSVRELLRKHYTAAQLDAALGPAFGVDRQLIRDGTYFVVEQDGEIVGCGGWSRRRAVCGADRDGAGADVEMHPGTDAARIRAFFVEPGWERRGIGRALLRASEAAATAAGFDRLELAATLAGEPLYAAHGYSVIERCEAELPAGERLAIVRMEKSLV